VPARWLQQLACCVRVSAEGKAAEYRVSCYHPADLGNSLIHPRGERNGECGRSAASVEGQRRVWEVSGERGRSAESVGRERRVWEVSGECGRSAERVGG
jgi:hypothetical protein